MDDLKLSPEKSAQLQSTLEIESCFNQSISMEFGLDKVQFYVPNVER